MTLRRALLAGAGLLALVAAAVIPAGWFVPLPPTVPLPPPPISGHTLVRICLLLDGLALLWLASRQELARRSAERGGG